MKAVWRVTRERDYDNWGDGELPPFKDVDVWGPGGCDTENRHFDYRFRLIDDDGGVQAEGMCNEAAIDAFGLYDPLHCYGMGMFGCTELWIRNKGKWEQV